MAVELEQTVMAAIGLGQHYNWYNGSGSCGYIRRDAVERLAGAAKKHGLSIAPAWQKHCETAIRVDACDSEYTLTNVWIACSYAIQDAIYRKDGGKGFEPSENWHFFTDAARQAWARQQLSGMVYRKGYGHIPARFDFNSDEVL